MSHQPDWLAVVAAARRARGADATEADRAALADHGLRLLRTTHNAVFAVGAGTATGGGAAEGAGGDAAGVNAPPHFCLKLLGPDTRRAPESELHALRLLAAEGYPFAPKVVHYDPAPPPALAVTFIDGREMSKRPLTEAELTALTQALQPLYRITPDTARDQAAARSLPSLDHARTIGSRVAAQADSLSDLPTPDDADAADLRAAALELANRWLAGPDDDLLATPAPPVFSRCDINFSNCLWDGKRVHVIDLEMAGWRDRAYDLSDTIELDYAWSYGAQYEHTPEDRWASFIDQMELDAAEHRRLAAARRSFAIFWTLREVSAAKDTAKASSTAAQVAHTRWLIG